MSNDWKLFWKDIAIGLSIFAATTACLILRVPVLGHPIAMLAGPAVGIYLCLLHGRPAKTGELAGTITPGIYRHFKGGKYRVFLVSTGTEDGQKVVVYMPLYGAHVGNIAHRTLENFTEEVDRPELNYKGPRFTGPLPE